MQFIFSPFLELYRVLPQSGPKENQFTSVRLYGSGFNTQKDQVYSKFGVLGTQEIV
jgi:hypothetical protein